MKLKGFCTAKKTLTRQNDETAYRNLEKVFANSTSKRELIARTYKEFHKVNTKFLNYSINKLPRELNRQFSGETQIIDMYFKKV